MATKITNLNWKTLLKKSGRYAVADAKGLSLMVREGRLAYWVSRYRIDGKERATSLGSAHEITLADARDKHLKVRDTVRNDKRDPVGERRAKRQAASAKADTPTFGEMADQHIASHEAGWKNPKHRDQWRMTLLGSKERDYCSAIRELPVDKVDAKAVLSVLSPIWNRTPETASRLRGRIEAVLAAAQVAGFIDPDKPNPARWKGWLGQMLPDPKKIGDRGHHEAMPYADVPAFMAKLKEADGTAAKALMFAILTASRTGEVIGMTFDEIADLDGDKPTWIVPKERMKMAREHRVPLSDAAVDILRVQFTERGKNPFVFPSAIGQGQKVHKTGGRHPLSNMALAMTMRRLGAGEFTVHGFRSSARSWMADHGVEFEVAESCLAHQVGNAVVQAYQRSSMVERRRPVMQRWADFLAEADTLKVVQFGRRADS